MIWQYTYTPAIWPSVFTVILLTALAVYAWRRRRMPGALPFTIACLFAALWAAGSVMEHVAVDLETKIFWIKFQSFWQPPLVTVVTCFLLEYTWPGRWLTRRNLVLFSILPLLIDGMVLTNNLHHLAWRSFTSNGVVQPQVGLGGWIAYVYAFGGLGILNLVVFGWLFLHSPVQRWPVALMMLGQFGGRILYLLERSSLLQSSLPMDLLGMAFEFLMYAIALFGFQILDPIPLAHQAAIRQLRSGMLVLDPQGKIVSLNPAAERILGTPARQVKGKPIKELLPAYPGGRLPDPDEIEIEFSLLGAGSPTGMLSKSHLATLRPQPGRGHSLERTPGTSRDSAGNLPDGAETSQDDLEAGRDVRQYMLAISQLKDWRGLEIGRLLILNDVSGIKRAEVQLLEQQRALAMLQEREQLARELHDSIGQVLGYASLKASAARKLIADGKLAKADDQLAHLEGSLTEAHADVREYILNLRIAPIGDKPFFSALQIYLDGYCQNYGIRVEVSIGPTMDKSLLAPEAQIQLFRILQEALSNARKHAATNYVSISFVMEDGRVHMRVQDNGKGFDPLNVAGAGGGHFGLSIMRERAEQLGGTLRVQSAPGEGTWVEVDVPVRGKIEAG